MASAGYCIDCARSKVSNSGCKVTQVSAAIAVQRIVATFSVN
jgi:hypothetical protein